MKQAADQMFQLVKIKRLQKIKMSLKQFPINFSHFISRFVFVGNVVDIYQREFLALRDRLHYAEQENLKRSKELNLVLDEIKRAIAEKQALRDINRTWSSLSGKIQTQNS